MRDKEISATQLSNRSRLVLIFQQEKMMHVSLYDHVNDVFIEQVSFVLPASAW